jgi:hypothetical protein
MTTPVVFGGTYRPFRRALSPVVGLYSATSVHPEVLQAISGSLLSTKYDLVVAAGLSLCLFVPEVLESDLLVVVGQPSMRQHFAIQEWFYPHASFDGVVRIRICVDNQKPHHPCIGIILVYAEREEALG